MTENSLLNLRRCPNCGHFVPVGVALCPDCGATIPSERVAHPSEPERVLEIGGLITKNASLDFVLGIATPFVISVVFTLVQAAFASSNIGGLTLSVPFNLVGVFVPSILLFVVVRNKYNQYARGLLGTLRVLGWFMGAVLLILLGLLAFCMTVR